jgi:hypothetical protein
MARESVSPSLDLPKATHKRLPEAAARKGCSARRLIFEGVEKLVGATTGTPTAPVEAGPTSGSEHGKANRPDRPAVL